jgi:hypothetical protein
MFQKVVESSSGRLSCEEGMIMRGFAPVFPGLALNIGQRAAIKVAMGASRLYVRPLFTLTNTEDERDADFHYVVVFRLADHPPLVWDSWDQTPSRFTKLSLLWHIGPDLGDAEFEYGYLRAGQQQKSLECALQVLFMVGLVGSFFIRSNDDLLDALRFRVLPLPISTYNLTTLRCCSAYCRAIEGFFLAGGTYLSNRDFKC